MDLENLILIGMSEEFREFKDKYHDLKILYLMYMAIYIHIYIYIYILFQFNKRVKALQNLNFQTDTLILPKKLLILLLHYYSDLIFLCDISVIN